MHLWEGVTLAMHQIRTQKLKSFFSLLGVILGVMFLIVVVTSFVATTIAAVGVLLKLGSQPQIALAASVLLLVPGVPLMNSSKSNCMSPSV